MKNKNSSLLFVISFAVLIALQGYYIYSSYNLEERKFNLQVNNIADKVLKSLPMFEKRTDESSLVRAFTDFAKNPTSQDKKIENLRENYRNNKYFTQLADSVLKIYAANTNLNIALRNEIFSVFDKINQKELLANYQPIVLFKTKRDVKNGRVINEGLWNANQTLKDTELKLDNNYHFLIKSNTKVELLNANTLVFKKILPLLLLSVFITLLLIYLFWKSLKNLQLQQKKIAQLHTTIDSIAHELNTPLTTIKFALQTAPNNQTNTIINRQALRIEKVVSSIHYQSITSNLADKNSIETYLNDIKAHYSHLTFNIKTNFSCNNVLSQNDFEKMMNNLLENASKYKANHVDIVVLFNNQIEISIADNGIGIPLAEQKLIFEKYYRVSRAENMQVNGLGIGLYLVNQIVKNHKGKIAVQTNANKGVTFNINLPNEN